MPASIRFGRSGASSLSRTTNMPAAAFTVMRWTKITATGAAQGLVSVGGASFSLNMSVSSGGDFRITESGVADYTNSTFGAGLWQHTALVYAGGAGGAFLGYFNGALDLNQVTTGSQVPTSITIGNNNFSQAEDGYCAGLKIWNRLLTIGEIRAEMAFAMPVNPHGLNSCTPVPGGWDMATSGLLIPRTSAMTRWGDIAGTPGNDWTETGVIDTDLGPPIQFALPTQQRARYPANAAAGGGAYGLPSFSFVGGNIF